MASFQPSWFSSLRVISPAKPALFSHANTGVASTTTLFRPATKLCCCAVGPEDAESSESEAQTGPVDPVKLAFSKAKAYKESLKKSNSSLGTEQQSAAESSTVTKEDFVDGGGQKELPVSVKIAMEKAKKYKQNKGVMAGETETIQGNSHSSIVLLLN